MTTILRTLCLAVVCVPLLVNAASTEGNTKLTRETVQAGDGLDLVCDVGGRGDAALILLHGWCGTREYWKNQVDAFSDDYRIVALDQAGHGDSGKERTEWTIARLAEDVETVVRDFALSRVIIIGHSMGGPVGLLAAKRMPGKVVAVIGVDTLQNVEVKMREDLAKEYLNSMTADFQGSLRSLYEGLLPGKADPELKNWIITLAVAQDQKMALGLMRDMTTNVNLKELLKQANVPVRCINSAGGFGFFTPTAIDINKKYGNYNAVFIEDVGHYPMLEKPAEFNRRLQETLKEFAKK